MDKTIKIYDYTGDAKEILIEKFEDVLRADCEVISGDEVLTIIYKDGTKKVFDSCLGGRLIGYDDGMVKIPLDKIDKLSEIPNSYDMLDYFWDLEESERE